MGVLKCHSCNEYTTENNSIITEEGIVKCFDCIQKEMTVEECHCSNCMNIVPCSQLIPILDMGDNIALCHNCYNLPA